MFRGNWLLFDHKMFSQIDHKAEIATCAYFLGFQRTDKVNRNYFSSVEKRRIFSARASQTYMGQSQSARLGSCAFLSRRARLPWGAQKMCAVTIVGTVLKVMSQDNLSILVITIPTYTHADIIITFNHQIFVWNDYWNNTDHMSVSVVWGHCYPEQVGITVKFVCPVPFKIQFQWGSGDVWGTTKTLRSPMFYITCVLLMFLGV